LTILRSARGVNRDICELESDETEICPWDERVCLEAIRFNHIDILTFALENSCPFGRLCSDAASKSKNPEILDCVIGHYESLRTKNI